MYNRYHYKIISLFISIILYTFIYSILNPINFSGINTIQDKIKLYNTFLRGNKFIRKETFLRHLTTRTRFGILEARDIRSRLARGIANPQQEDEKMIPGGGICTNTPGQNIFTMMMA